MDLAVKIEPKMKHLLDIKSLTTSKIAAIAERAIEIKNGAKPLSLKEKQVAMMFFENSTRTKFSFEMALNRLSATAYNFETSKSSISKGEYFFDTLNNLSAIGFDACIIRTSQEGLVKDTLEKQLMGRKFFRDIAIINAGEGQKSHPTQALLDFVTLKEIFGNINGLNLTIIGDIRHSRVAKSNIELLSRFNVNIKCVAPSYFRDESIKNAQWVDNLADGLQNADVAMILRIQKERIQEKIELEDYIKNYQLTDENLPAECILMHPGPVNRDVEANSALLNSKKGDIILKQANNGVYTRMAVLEMILGEKSDKN